MRYPNASSAISILLIENSAWAGCSKVTNLALIYTWVGERDRALEQLTTSAKTPFGVTYGELKLSPVWDPLRNDPRFQKLAKSPTPK